MITIGLVKHVLGRRYVVKATLKISFVYPCLRRAESEPGQGLQTRAYSCVINTQKSSHENI
jgi:hypothetical protein